VDQGDVAEDADLDVVDGEVFEGARLGDVLEVLAARNPRTTQSNS
jgi:hypothetical protein